MANYGEVNFEGKEYLLTDTADFTGSQIPFSYIDREEGQEYDFEMSAPATDSEGNEYIVYWIFTAVKGEDMPELDTFDYDNVNRVVSI